MDVCMYEAFRGFGKMPDFTDVLDLVAQRKGFLQFRGAPRTSESMFMIRVSTLVGSLQGGWSICLAHRWRRGER